MTCYSQITSDNNVVIPPEFVFKGVDACTYAFLLVIICAKVKLVKWTILHIPNGCLDAYEVKVDIDNLQYQE